MRRIPKRGFNQTMFRSEWSLVGLGDLKAVGAKEVNPKSLAAAGLIRDERGLVKILSNGVVSGAYSVTGCSVSASAKASILAAGGSVE
jgi:large subunit ribosomal protein L15